MNITIKTKLIIGFIFIAMIGVIIGYNAISNLKTINADSIKLYEKVTVPLTQIGRAETNFNKIRMKVRDTVLSYKDVNQTKTHIETIKKLEQSIFEDSEEFSKTILTKEGRQVYDNYMASFKNYMLSVNKITDLALASNGEEAYKMMTDASVVAATKTADDALKATVELKMKVGSGVADANAVLAEKAITAMTVLTVISLVLSIFLGFFISGGINKILTHLVAECQRLTDCITSGKLGIRGNVEETNFEFQPITRGINEIMDALIKPLNVTAEYVDRISKGDIPAKITDAYKGDFNEIKNNINQCIDSIKLVIRDAGMLSAAAQNGDFKTRANETQHNGDFRKVIIELNATVDAFVKPLTRSIDHLENLSNGIVEENITQEYKGEFNRLKISFNKCFNAINLLITDTKMLVQASLDGNLDKRADAGGHHGDYAKIINGINNTLDAVITPVKECAACLEEISRGNLDTEMQGDYKGDHAILKNALNSTVISINEILG